MTLDRRTLLKGTVATTALLAAPFVTTSSTFGQTPKVRRDVQKMTPTDRFFTDYADAITAMHNLPSSDQRNWRNQALIHLNHCPHGMINFFPWHRWYIYYYESICAELIGNPDFTLPYWNWAGNGGTIPDLFYSISPAPTKALNVTYWKDPSNASSPNWGGGVEVKTIGVRSLKEGQGVQAATPNMFDQAALDTDLDTSDFTTLWHNVEGGPHNNAHVIVGGWTGHMGNGMSPLDPIFWLHHCQVDRMWAIWQNRGNSTPPIAGDYKGQFVDAGGTVQDAPNAENSYAFMTMNNGNGYTYEDLEQTGPDTMVALSERASTGLALTATQPKVIASSSATAAAKVGETTDVTVRSDELVSALFATRTFRALGSTAETPRIGVGTGRIYARFSGITSKTDLTGVQVRVFVSAPDVDARTSLDAATFAGAFAFFGHNPDHASMTYVVDVTRTVQRLLEDGLMSAGEVNLQLVPVVIGPEGPDPTFSVGKIELVAV